MSARATVHVKRLLRHAGHCDRTGCHLHARFRVIDLGGNRHFLCPGHKDAALAALSAFTGDEKRGGQA